MEGTSGSGEREQLWRHRSMIYYQERPRGPLIYWCLARKIRRCDYWRIYSYPNQVVLAVIDERRILTRDNDRAQTEIGRMRVIMMMQRDRI